MYPQRIDIVGHTQKKQNRNLAPEEWEAQVVIQWPDRALDPQARSCFSYKHFIFVLKNMHMDFVQNSEQETNGSTQLSNIYTALYTVNTPFWALWHPLLSVTCSDLTRSNKNISKQ